MNDEKCRFLKKAERCRRIAGSINDAEAIARLIKLAEEYEARAAEL